jgi:hypothetical protein
METVNKLINYVEIRIGGGWYCTSCKSDSKDGKGVCGAMLTKEHYKLDVIRDMMKKYANVDITEEQAQQIVDGKYPEANKYHSCFIREMGDETADFLDLIENQCWEDKIDLTWSEDLGRCTGTEFGYAEGMLIDRSYPNYMEIWHGLTNNRTATNIDNTSSTNRSSRPDRASNNRSLPPTIKRKNTPRPKHR